MPVPQEMNFIVEQASCLLSENGARCEVRGMSANTSAECGAIELARAWQKTLKHPESRLFSLSVAANPELVSSYLQAEATAANYGFINRLLLAELLRWRWR